MKKDIYTALINKKRNNQISTTELIQLNNWLDESPENQALAEKLDKKKSSKFLSFKSIIIVVAVLILILLGFQYLEYRTQAEAIVNSENKTKTVNFVDGSTAVLAPNSIIKYSNYFNKKGRFVELVKGEANFSVVEQKEKFRVKTERELITVVGTVFDVQFDKNQTKVTVQEGQVSIRQNVTKIGQIDVRAISLTSGETAVSVVDSLYKTTN